MDDRSVLQPVDAGAEVQVDVLGPPIISQSVTQLSSPAQTSVARGRKCTAILESYYKYSGCCAYPTY